MTYYKPMTTLKEVKAWARANGLTYRYEKCTARHQLSYKKLMVIFLPFMFVEGFKDEANALRQWQEENPV